MLTSAAASRTLADDFINNTLESNKFKVMEKERFKVCMKESRAKIDAASIALVHKFESKKKKLLRQLEDMREEDAIKKLKELQDANVCPRLPPSPSPHLPSLPCWTACLMSGSRGGEE